MDNHILKLPFIFDKKKLIEDLSQVNESFLVKHPNTNYPTPLFSKMSYIPKILENFKTKIEAVRFMNLKANSQIKEHCDRESYLEKGFIRIHIPISTNEKVKFILDSIEEKLELGCCYYINADKPHCIENLGTTDRIHLLIDCKVNGWLKQLFYNQGFVEEKSLYNNHISDENIDDVIKNLKLMNTIVPDKLIKDFEKMRDRQC
ncbi:MAG: aspartyl/asparaginyl beta-hydroxylase domain-containing protein [Halarcobacter sp.]